MRRWIKRLFIVIAILMMVGGGVTWWLFKQTSQVPEFYTRATAQLPVETAEASEVNAPSE